MSKRFLPAVVLAVPLAAAAAPATYTIDPFHTYPGFSIDHLGMAMIQGKFNKTSGKFTIDVAAKSGAVDLAVDTSTVDTGDNDKGTRVRSRDEHLRSPDFFNVAVYPTMNYKATKVTFNGDNPASVEGELTIVGITKPLTLTLQRFKCNQAAAPARERCGGTATGKFNRSDYGLKQGIPSIGDEITLTIAFEGLKELN